MASIRSDYVPLCVGVGGSSVCIGRGALIGRIPAVVIARLRIVASVDSLVRNRQKGRLDEDPRMITYSGQHVAALTTLSSTARLV